MECNVKRLNFISDIKKSGSTCIPFDGKKRYVATGDVLDNEIVSYEEVTYKDKPSRANVCCDIGDVLFAKMKNTVKVLLINAENVNYIYSTGFYCFRDARFNPKYLRLFFMSRYFNKNKDLNSSGATMMAINDDGMKKIYIPLYKNEIQEKIIEELNLFESIMYKLKRQIANLDDLIKSRFIEMFGDPILNEKNWPVKSLIDMGVCKNGMNFRYDEKGIDINCLGVGDFKNCSIITNTADLPVISLNEMPSDEYLLKDGDIVFVRSNGNKSLVGRSVAVYPGITPTTFSGFCIRYRKNDESILVSYLLHVLKTERIRSKMVGRGANIQNLNQQILGSLIIAVPPLELQNKFALFVEQIDKLKFRNLTIFNLLRKYYIIYGRM